MAYARQRAIKGRLIGRKGGACLQAIQLVAIAGKQAPTHRVNLSSKPNGNPLPPSCVFWRAKDSASVQRPSATAASGGQA